MHYTINGNNIFTQPVNYTTKLSDILDSILYMLGLYRLESEVDIREIYKTDEFKEMFFIIHDFIEPVHHPLHDIQGNTPIIYDKCVFEIFSLDEHIFKSGQFIGKNLPYKVVSSSRRYRPELLCTRTLNKEEAHEKIKRISELVNCPILIVGPYLSLTKPQFVNCKREQTQEILKEICEIEDIRYFDMTDSIVEDNAILVSAEGRESHETHFTEKGNAILSNVIYDFLK